MPKFTELDGVFFTEETLELQVLGQVKAQGTSQNTSLLEVKRRAAQKVKELGGNALMEHRYSQKADSVLKDIFWIKRDSERVTITGSAVKVSSSTMQEDKTSG